MHQLTQSVCGKTQIRLTRLFESAVTCEKGPYVYLSSKCSDQPVHPRSLSSAFLMNPETITDNNEVSGSPVNF